MNTTLELPLPHLAKGRFLQLAAYTDERLFEAVGVRIAFTERAQGVSSGPYDSLNFGEHVDDDPACVAKNRSLLCEAFNTDPTCCVVPHQVHGDHLVLIDPAAREDLSFVIEQARSGADGLVVEASDVGALLCFADCMPVIIVSPTGRFAVVHAGWRGVENEIAVRALRLLSECDARHGFTGDPGSFNVYIGPYIHGECFEAGESVHQLFADRFGPACIKDERHIDLGQAMRVSLDRSGILSERIADIEACTVCEHERFFSYRAQSGVCGRHGAFAVRQGGAQRS